MQINVDPDWWKELFDEIYLLTDARSVCDETLTQKEVDVICELLPVRHGDRILDMCRTGVNVTGDLSCAAFVARTEGEINLPEVDPEIASSPIRT